MGTQSLSNHSSPTASTDVLSQNKQERVQELGSQHFYKHYAGQLHVGNATEMLKMASAESSSVNAIIAERVIKFRKLSVAIGNAD